MIHAKGARIMAASRIQTRFSKTLLTFLMVCPFLFFAGIGHPNLNNGKSYSNNENKYARYGSHA